MIFIRGSHFSGDSFEKPPQLTTGGGVVHQASRLLGVPTSAFAGCRRRPDAAAPAAPAAAGARQRQCIAHGMKERRTSLRQGNCLGSSLRCFLPMALADFEGL